MDRDHDKDISEIPLSESNVSLELAAIQRRCSELLTDSGEPLGLSLEEEEAPVERDTGNPYDRG